MIDYINRYKVRAHEHLSRAIEDIARANKWLDFAKRLNKSTYRNTNMINSCMKSYRSSLKSVDFHLSHAASYLCK